MADGTSSPDLGHPALRLPDVRRARGLPQGHDVVRAVGDAALAWTWRMLEPGVRSTFLRADRRPLSRLNYRTDDGWSADLFVVPAAVSGGGEPVLLAHGLGGSHRDFVLDAERSLASFLSAAGFSVYILEHRGDPSSVPPADAAPFSVDDIATRDLPAAIDAILAHSGYDRCLFVGAGLGAQAYCLANALGGEDRVAGACLIAPAVVFPRPETMLRAAGLVSQVLPRGWNLPARRLQQLATPFIHEGADLGSPDTDPALLRGRLRHASGDLSAGVAAQVARWWLNGSLCDQTGRLDVVRAMRPLPLQIFIPDADPACPAGACDPLFERQNAQRIDLKLGWGHLDPLLGERAPTAVYAPIRDFLSPFRRACR